MTGHKPAVDSDVNTLSVPRDDRGSGRCQGSWTTPGTVGLFQVRKALPLSE